ncbi:MAG TPA: hypothetical protein VGC67_07210 [Cellulomonas sp.]
MTILVETAAVAEAGTTLLALARDVPELPSAPSGSTGSPEVDGALADLLAHLDGELGSASAAVHALGTGAAGSLETITAADQQLRLVR